MLCYVMLYYITLRYVMLYYMILCYVIIIPWYIEYVSYYVFAQQDAATFSAESLRDSARPLAKQLVWVLKLVCVRGSTTIVIKHHILKHHILELRKALTLQG